MSSPSRPTRTIVCDWNSDPRPSEIPMRSIPLLVVRLCSIVLCIATMLPVAARAQAPIDPSAYSRLQWRYVGPVGNRVAALADVPGDPNVYYAGAASGGLCKNTASGIHSAQTITAQHGSSLGALD